MHIQERYAVARSTSNLKVDARTSHSAADVLGAVGMAAQSSPEALMLWEVTFRGKTSAKLALVDMLAKKLTVQMIREKWKGDPRKITQEVIAWHLEGVCKPCSGRKYEAIAGTPTLSDRICRHCNGSGKVRLPRGDAHSWLADHIGRLISQAAGHVMKKLAADMNF